MQHVDVTWLLFLIGNLGLKDLWSGVDTIRHHLKGGGVMCTDKESVDMHFYKQN
jgi:hypothetical protein